MAQRPRSNIRYRQAIVTFIDILGFSELIAVRAADEILELIGLLKSFGGVRASTRGYTARLETKAVNFSDSIVRVRYFDFDDGEGEGAIFYEALHLVHAQADLVNQGVFVRGGITVGPIYARGNNIFGPAFVRAYELESSFANFPRIVAGPEVFAALRSDARLSDAVAHDVHYLRRLFRKGDDGLWFIDYLKAIMPEMDDPDLHPELLGRHRENIIRNANQASSLRTLQKYLWLSTYHNKVNNEMYEMDDLSIKSDDITALELLDDVAVGVDHDFD